MFKTFFLNPTVIKHFTRNDIKEHSQNEKMSLDISVIIIRSLCNNTV